ncbi:hypothetical protein [Paenibacillus arenilitoris]|uniref:Uncharacterized protein n=1 Tax=Paenibacillus arenilitoris TaxID=2772299 RepID=A0A927H9X9_9BACL|nr:hypothetical protein [Paenibacillus arenilitoris]MBD2872074.1 hypothetical protein [Paenibacillus arenilitoris]
MLERIIVLLSAYGLVFLYDAFHWKGGSGKRDKTVYAVIIVISVYLGIEYVAGMDLFGLYEWVDLVYTDSARTIDQWLKGPGK